MPNKDPKKRQARLKRWKARNPVRNRWHFVNSGARLRGGEGELPFADFVALLRSVGVDPQTGTGGICPACGCAFVANTKHCWTLDHVKPLGIGGTHTADNVQILCWQCNEKKGLDDQTRHFPCTLGIAEALT